VNRDRIEEVIRAAILEKTSAAASIFVTPKNVRSFGCAVDCCSRPAYAGGLCNAHYIRKRAGKEMSSPVRARKRADACSECGKSCGGKGGWGMCQVHYRAARYRAIKSALVEVMGGACGKCGGEFPIAVYDFHHVGDKSDSPGELISNASVERIAEEVSRCVLLCANCHRIEHYDERI
jgi:hypothetical protein